MIAPATGFPSGDCGGRNNTWHNLRWGRLASRDGYRTCVERNYRAGAPSDGSPASPRPEVSGPRLSNRTTAGGESVGRVSLRYAVCFCQPAPAKIMPSIIPATTIPARKPSSRGNLRSSSAPMTYPAITEIIGRELGPTTTTSPAANAPVKPSVPIFCSSKKRLNKFSP